MPVPIYVVDAFTARPFSGNPAAVCLLEESKPPEWMQSVAAEMKHAETAFVSPGLNGFDLRWFTPASEVDLCGHATLAAAHALWESKKLSQEEPAIFRTKSGALTCTRHGYGIQMDFPAERATAKHPFDADAICGAIGISGAKVVLANRMDILVQVADSETLRDLRPNFPALAAFGTRGVIVTSLSDSPEYDFLSRFFAPGVGIDEDPVTGSAHCCLGPFWSERLDKDDLVAYQCSPRGGTVRVAVRGDRILLQGQAVTTLIGEFLV